MGNNEPLLKHTNLVSAFKEIRRWWQKILHQNSVISLERRFDVQWKCDNISSLIIYKFSIAEGSFVKKGPCRAAPTFRHWHHSHIKIFYLVSFHYVCIRFTRLYTLPGALLVSILTSILTSNKTWRTRNAGKSSNGDCEKITQYFAMMSASDLFAGCMRPSMAS